MSFLRWILNQFCTCNLPRTCLCLRVSFRHWCVLPDGSAHGLSLKRALDSEVKIYILVCHRNSLIGNYKVETFPISPVLRSWSNRKCCFDVGLTSLGKGRCISWIGFTKWLMVILRSKPNIFYLIEISQLMWKMLEFSRGWVCWLSVTSGYLWEYRNWRLLTENCRFFTYLCL